MQGAPTYSCSPTAAAVRMSEGQERVSIKEFVGVPGIHSQMIVGLDDVALNTGGHRGHVSSLGFSLAAHQAMQQQPAQRIALQRSKNRVNSGLANPLQ